jgi:hypothetical protein
MNQVGIVLNVQQGQTVRPITLVPGKEILITWHPDTFIVSGYSRSFGSMYLNRILKHHVNNLSPILKSLPKL